MIAMGVDQGARSGWGLSIQRTVVAHGVALNHKQRLAVLELVKSRNCGSLQGVLVCFEDHTTIPLERLTRADSQTPRHHSDRAGAPERNTAGIIGQGAAWGRWLELLDLLEHPKALRMKVPPQVWRARLGIRGKGTDALKAAACRFASLHSREEITDGDQAEGYALAVYAGIDGIMRNEIRKAEQRIDYRGRTQSSRQTALPLDVPPGVRR
jgi:hypothetical protein